MNERSRFDLRKFIDIVRNARSDDTTTKRLLDTNTEDKLREKDVVLRMQGIAHLIATHKSVQAYEIFDIPPEYQPLFDEQLSYTLYQAMVFTRGYGSTEKYDKKMSRTTNNTLSILYAHGLDTWTIYPGYATRDLYYDPQSPNFINLKRAMCYASNKLVTKIVNKLENTKPESFASNFFGSLAYSVEFPQPVESLSMYVSQANILGDLSINGQIDSNLIPILWKNDARDIRSFRIRYEEDLKTLKVIPTNLQ